MGHLSYKTFVWPRNPQTYQESSTRKAKYHTADGITYYDGMGDLQRVIRGSGVFFGEGAFDTFKQLVLLMEEKTAGNLEHPVWGIRYCYFTGLELTQEPRENYVSYSFEFTQALANGVVPN